jgi:heme-degrading monooxygenase HmoA
MIHTLTFFQVDDVRRFVGVFATRGQPLRRRNGSRGAQILQLADDPSRVAVLIAWDSKEAFEAFLKDQDAPASMQASGVRSAPKFEFLQALA